MLSDHVSSEVEFSFLTDKFKRTTGGTAVAPKLQGSRFWVLKILNASMFRGGNFGFCSWV